MISAVNEMGWGEFVVDGKRFGIGIDDNVIITVMGKPLKKTRK